MACFNLVRRVLFATLLLQFAPAFASAMHGKPAKKVLHKKPGRKLAQASLRERRRVCEGCMTRRYPYQFRGPSTTKPWRSGHTAAKSTAQPRDFGPGVMAGSERLS
jgi:hypothetical protein